MLCQSLKRSVLQQVPPSPCSMVIFAPHAHSATAPKRGLERQVSLGARTHCRHAGSDEHALACYAHAVFEKLEISDFNTIDTNGPVGFTPETGAPRIDWLGGLITGYGNRPYAGHTAHLRVLYRF